MKLQKSRNKREGRYVGKIGGWIPRPGRARHQRTGPLSQVMVTISFADVAEFHRASAECAYAELASKIGVGYPLAGLLSELCIPNQTINHPATGHNKEGAP